MDFDRYPFDEFINNCMNSILRGDEVSLNLGIIMVSALNSTCHGLCFGDVGLKNRQARVLFMSRVTMSLSHQEKFVSTSSL